MLCFGLRPWFFQRWRVGVKQMARLCSRPGGRRWRHGSAPAVNVSSSRVANREIFVATGMASRKAAIPRRTHLCLGWPAADLTWRCYSLEIGPGPATEPLEAAANSGDKLTLLELLHLATPNVQVIDGEVIGYACQDGQLHPVVVLRAVDSTSWDLELSNESDFQRILAAFPETVELSAKLFRT